MNVLILGSAPDVVRVQEIDLSCFDKIVAINNAWNVCESWNYCIFPKDFPNSKRPLVQKDQSQKLITHSQYVPIQNQFGGFIYAGGTMAFTAGYWALGALQPKSISYLGCDMVYDASQTHFYGIGKADPLRNDITLRNLRAKSARLEAIAGLNNCMMFNLSEKKRSQLIFRRMAV